MERASAVALAILAIGGAIALIGKAIRWMITTLRRLGHLADDLLGEPERDDHPGRPGLMGRLAALDGRIGAIDARLSRVEAELKPDHGRSLRDRIDTIAAQVAPQDGEAA